MTHQEGSRPAIDPTIIEELRSIGDASFLAELVEIYVTDAPPRIEALRSAIQGADAQRAAQAAHALKSSSGNVGATLVRELCAELEERARSGSLDDAAATLTLLEGEYDRAVRELRAIVAGVEE